MAETRWLTVVEVAERVRVHPETVRRMLREGRLPGKLLSRAGGWRVSEADLNAFMGIYRDQEAGDG